MKVRFVTTLEFDVDTLAEAAAGCSTARAVAVVVHRELREVTGEPSKADVNRLIKAVVERRFGAARRSE